MQREDLTVNLTVDMFLKSRCMHLPLYPCSFDGKIKKERHANQKRFGGLV
jgi:hypothetical protein